MYLYAIYNFCFWHLHEKWPFINKYCSTLTKLLHLLHIHTEKWPDQISYSWWNIDTHIPGFTTNNSEGNRLTKSIPLFHNSKRERDWFYQKLTWFWNLKHLNVSIFQENILYWFHQLYFLHSIPFRIFSMWMIESCSYHLCKSATYAPRLMYSKSTLMELSKG